MSDEFSKDDEIITVNMPRKDYVVLRTIIEREKTYTWIKNSIRSFWVWALAGGLLALFALGDKISNIVK